MLLGTSISFAISVTKSGLAQKIADAIISSESRFVSLLTIYVITLIITEFISNNAAASMMYPIAVASIKFDCLFAYSITIFFYTSPTNIETS